MAQDTTTTLLIISVLGTMRVYVVLLAGFLASTWPRHEPLLNKEACRFISRTCAQLFLPALVLSSTGGTLNPAALRDSWQLVVAGGLTIALSVFLSGALGRLLLQPEDRRAFRPVQLAVAFPNCLGFPLLLMESLCEQDGINRDFRDNAVECFTEATGMLFTYFAVFQVCFYGWGFYAIGDGDTLELKLTGQPVVISPPSIADAHVPSFDSSRAVTQKEGLPSVTSMHRTVGTGLAAIAVQLGNTPISSLSAREGAHHVMKGTPPAQDGGEDGNHGTELPQMEAGAVSGTPPFQEDTGVLPLAAEDAQEGVFYANFKRFATGHRRSDRGTSTARVASVGVADDPGHSSWARVHHRVSIVLRSPNIIAVMIGIAIAMIFYLQQQLFHNPLAVLRPLGAAIETLGTPTVAVTTLVMAGSLVQTSTVEAGGALEGGSGEIQWNMRRFRFVAGGLQTMCRLVLVPAAGFTTFWVARTYTTAMGENRLMHLIMLIELAMPSAALVIVSLNQLAMPATAGFMARLYLSQYGASMFTITLWTALAVHMVY